MFSKMMIPIIGMMAVIFTAAISSTMASSTKWVTLESRSGDSSCHPHHIENIKFLILATTIDEEYGSYDSYFHEKDDGRNRIIYTKDFTASSQVEEIDCSNHPIRDEEDIWIANAKCMAACKAENDSLIERREAIEMYKEYQNLQLDHMGGRGCGKPPKTPINTTALKKTSQWIDAGDSTGISFMVFDDGSDLIYIKEYGNIEYGNIEVIDCSIKPLSSWIMPKCMLAEVLWIEESLEKWKAKFESFQKNKRSTTSYLDLIAIINDNLDETKALFEYMGTSIKEINKTKRLLEKKYNYLLINSLLQKVCFFLLFALIIINLRW